MTATTAVDLPDPRQKPTLTVEEVAHLLGIGRSLAYDLAARDELPVPVIRIGSLYRFPTVPVLTLLGLDGGAAGAA